jgi:16S rRNA processing protein RimM
MGEDALLAIGKVVGTHGIKGYLKVFSYAESIDSFAPDNELTLSREGVTVGTFRTKSVRPHKGVILLALEGIGSIEAAKDLLGCDVCIDETSLAQPEEGTYYWYQIIGLEVFTLDNRPLGRVTSIMRTGSNDVYVVRDGKKEILIPALHSVILDIDLENKVMKVDLPEGLED